MKVDTKDESSVICEITVTNHDHFTIIKLFQKYKRMNDVYNQ